MEETDDDVSMASVATHLECGTWEEEESENAALLPFDFYLIAEGGWSGSTHKLGFDKSVQNYKPVFGFIINLKYDEADVRQKALRSNIWHALSKDWPLSNVPVLAEFVEYLKGETHFFALVVQKKHYLTEKAKLDGYDDSSVPEDVRQAMERSRNMQGLLEMGVFREDKKTIKELMAPSNFDEARLREMARLIVRDCGIPDDVPFFDVNPVQLFDFSRRGHCVSSCKLLVTGGCENNTTSTPEECGGGGPVNDSSNDATMYEERMMITTPQDSALTKKNCRVLDHLHAGNEESASHSAALVLPVGDALQEPLWTEGLGVNRGVHNVLNQCFACLVARESKSIKSGCEESKEAYRKLLNVKWGSGGAGLAGAGSLSTGIQPFAKWSCDWRDRLPGYA